MEGGVGVNHLEDLIGQFYEWRGYFVRRNILVGKRAAGGWEMELDVVAFHPKKGELLHIEASLDAHSWAKREQRFQKKFAAGRRYIHRDVFPWLDRKMRIQKQCILPHRGSNRTQLAGGNLLSVDEFMRQVKAEVARSGLASRSAIPEQFDLLRTIQLAVSGYYKTP